MKKNNINTFLGNPKKILYTVLIVIVVAAALVLCIFRITHEDEPVQSTPTVTVTEPLPTTEPTPSSTPKPTPEPTPEPTPTPDPAITPPANEAHPASGPNIVIVTMNPYQNSN